MKTNKLGLITIVILFVIGIQVRGQISTNELPVSFSLDESIELLGEMKSLPVLDMEQIQQEDLEDEQNGIPPRFGYRHQVSYNLNNSGHWTTLPNGDKIWQMEIYCPNALSINLLYDEFWIPEGSKFFIYNSDKTHSIGAFTSVNNKGTKENLREFATGLVYGDKITLEYYLPEGLEEQGIISIAYVVHGYRYINITDKAGFGQSGNCNINVNCSEGNDWQQEKNAVALILVNGNRWCSGSLINTTSQNNSPYFLTADHCLDGNKDAINDNNLNHWSFYWHYESPGCSNTTDPPHLSTVGATVVANNSFSDFALLSLTEDPKDVPGITPYYLGWDRTGNSGTGGVGIHHPNGDVKKITIYTISPLSTTYANSTTNTNGTHWKVQWSLGTTEGGSSGSPLINNNHKIIGQLHGGGASCNALTSPDWYGKFSVSWTGNGATDNRRKLSPWLDPTGTGVTVLDGITVDIICNSVVVPSISITGNTTWNSNRKIASIINVENGVTLTIQNATISFASVAKIIVKPGGRLLLDGCTLTNACAGELWQGIEVWGNPSNVQNTGSQGFLEMKNGATIENAACAVYAGSSNSKGGGIITARNSTFKNNKQALNFQPYTWINSFGWESTNTSEFIDCEFLTDNNALFPGSGFNVMVSLVNVRDISFRGCTFKDTRQKNTLSDYGIGIYANAASLSMECLGLPRYGHILIDYFDPVKLNEFYGFGQAILLRSSGTKASKIHWTKFENNNVAIFGSVVDKLSVESCEIHLNGQADEETMSGRHGIYIEYSDGYTIANNQFEGDGTGLRIAESGEGNNSVENNKFSNMCLAILASGVNGENVNSTHCTGLTFQCNEFIENDEDIRVDKNISSVKTSRIRYMQGSASYAAGNLFQSSTIAVYNNSPTHTVLYYYDNNDPNPNTNLHYPTGYGSTNNNLFTGGVSRTNCIGIGYLGNYYYTRPRRAIITPDMPRIDIINTYTEVYLAKKETLTEKINTYQSTYGEESINWNLILSSSDGIAAITTMPQVKLWVEISDLTQEVRFICREVISFLINEAEFDFPTYRVWLDRENTLKADYLLSQSYVESSDWGGADNVLQTIPTRFPQYSATEHSDFMTYLQFENQWGNTDPSQIPSAEIEAMQAIIFISILEGELLERYRALLERISRGILFPVITLDDKCGDVNTMGTEGITGFTESNSSSNSDKSINSSNNRNAQSLNDVSSYTLALYPNPSEEVLHLNLENTATVNIQQVAVYDIYGRQLRTKENIDVSKTFINLSGLTKGIYFIHVKMNSGEIKIRRIVKE
jgi:parallel beta-helix repeat protein